MFLNCHLAILHLNCLCYSSMKCFQMVFTLPKGMEKALYNGIKLCRIIWWIIVTSRVSFKVLIIITLDPTNQNYFPCYPEQHRLQTCQNSSLSRQHLITFIYCQLKPVLVEILPIILFSNVLEFFSSINVHMLTETYIFFSYSYNISLWLCKGFTIFIYLFYILHISNQNNQLL